MSDDPIIIPRQEHPISRADIDREALKVLYRLKDAGFAAYLVGGGVRDLYLGKTPKDFDISTSARPGELKKLFRNSRIIGRRFRLVQVFFKGGKIIEVSTFRCRSEYDLNGTNEVLPSNNTFGTPAEDAFRRDLTINALFYEIENFTVIDHVNGVADLKNQIIRMIGEPVARITHDPVRMMRAVRHAARSGFTIEPVTWQAIVEHADMLAICPTSRLRDELLKDLTGGACASWIQLAIDSGILFTLFPCYRGLLEQGSKSRKLLLTLGAIIDRLNSNHNMPEAMLLALLLLPYGLEKQGLMQDRRGNAFFAHSRQVRENLNELLALLNIKRADKEAITGLLTNLPVFARYNDQQQWPKRLQRKSYFKQGLQFYRIFVEATGGPAVDELVLPPRPKKAPPVRRRWSGSRTPAYAKNTKGGIFGLKR